jgi:hypothetical protein
VAATHPSNPSRRPAAFRAPARHALKKKKITAKKSKEHKERKNLFDFAVKIPD